MRNPPMLNRPFASFLIFFSLVSLVRGDDPAVSFDFRLLTLDANEGIAAGDVDGDGKTDLVAGRNWFRA